MARLPLLLLPLLTLDASCGCFRCLGEHLGRNRPSTQRFCAGDSGFSPLIPGFHILKRYPERGPCPVTPLLAAQSHFPADFGVDGGAMGDSRAAIQWALDAVSRSGGGALYFKKGVYPVAGPIAGRSGVAMVCLDAQECEIRVTRPHGAAIVFDGRHDASVENFRFMLTGLFPDSSTDGVAISIGGASSRIRIAHNWIMGHEHAGIQITDASDILISENVLENGTDTAGYTGTTVNGDIVVYGPMAGSRIENNRCLSHNDHGIVLEPNFGAVERNVVSGNIIENHNLHGINLYAASTGYVLDNIIEGNVVRRIATRRIGSGAYDFGIGIYVTGNKNGGRMGSGKPQTVRNRVLSNSVSDTLIGHTGSILPQGAISVSDAPETVIAGNLVRNSPLYGIWLSDTIGAGGGGLIEANRVIGCPRGGIRIMNCQGVRVFANRLEGAGITVSRSSAELSGNRMEDGK